jgi:putative ABC transport system permease protein
MLLNYYKISLRNLKKNKILSAINVAGLAIGMATSILLFFWISDELSYDRFHRFSDRILRVERRWDFKELYGQAPIAAAPWGPAMEDDFTEI